MLLCVEVRFVIVHSSDLCVTVRDADFPLFSVFSVIFGPIRSPISSFSF